MPHHQQTSSQGTKYGFTNSTSKKIVPQQQQRQLQTQSSQPTIRWYRVMTTLHPYPMQGPHFLLATNEQWYCDNSKCKHTTYGKFDSYPIPCWRSVELGTAFTLCDACVRTYSAARKARLSTSVSSPQISITLHVNPNVGNNNNNNGGNTNVVIPTVSNVSIDSGMGRASVSVPKVTVVMPHSITPMGQYDASPKKSSEEGDNSPYVSPGSDSTPGYNNKQEGEGERAVVQEGRGGERGEEEEGSRVVKQGWLLKQSDNFKIWKQRYFLLQSDGKLYYFENEQSKYHRGVIDIRKCRSIRCGNNTDFQIITDQQSWKFVAKKSEIRDDWVALICQISGCDIQ